MGLTRVTLLASVAEETEEIRGQVPDSGDRDLPVRCGLPAHATERTWAIVACRWQPRRYGYLSIPQNVG